MLSLLQKSSNIIDKPLRFLMILSGIFITLTVFIAVLLRYIFEIDLYAIDEFQMLAAYWFYFISAAYASSHGKQITADILTFILKSERSKLYVAIVVNILSVVILTLFAYWSKDLILFAISATQKTQVWRISMVYYYLPVVVGLTLMAVFAFRDLAQVISDLSSLGTKRGSGE